MSVTVFALSLLTAIGEHSLLYFRSGDWRKSKCSEWLIPNKIQSTQNTLLLFLICRIGTNPALFNICLTKRLSFNQIVNMRFILGDRHHPINRQFSSYPSLELHFGWKE